MTTTDSFHEKIERLENQLSLVRYMTTLTTDPVKVRALEIRIEKLQQKLYDVVDDCELAE